MKSMAKMFESRLAYEAAQQAGKLGQLPLVRDGQISWLPGLLGGWTAMRDLEAVPSETFREWWERRK